MSLSGWNKNNIIQLSTDKEKVGEVLNDFPILVNLSSTSGQNNYDCSSIFTELYIPTDDDFTGIDEDPPNEDRWNRAYTFQGTGTGYAKILSNKLACSVASNTTVSVYTGWVINIKTNFKLSGDFDIEYSFDSFSTNAGTGNCYAMLFIFELSSSYNGPLDTGSTPLWVSSLPGDSYITTSRTNDYGRVRLTRVGTTLTSYYDDGNTGSWTQHRTGTYTAVDCTVYIRPYMDQVDGDTSTSFSFNFTNFQINSGTVVWLQGTYPTRKKIAVEYIGSQEHWVETIDDDFTGTDGDDPNSALWTKIGPSKITNNTLDISYDQNGYIGVSSIQYLSGDFDIQIDFSNLSWSGVSVSQWPGINFYFYIDANNYSRVQLWENEASGTTYYTGRNRIDGTNYSNADIVCSTTSGKLRLTRIGDESDTLYWDASSSVWVSLTKTSGFPSTDGYIELRVYLYPSNVLTCNMDNFKVNYGTIDWLGNTPIKEFRSYSATRQQCYVEIENWDQTAQEAQLWVKVPFALSNQPTDLLLYYDSTQNDNTTYVGDVGDVPAQNVWDYNFVAVYHMNQDPSGGADAIKDSTSVGNHATSSGTMTSGDLVDGQIGEAIDFDGTGDAIDCGTNSSLNITENLTLESTINPRTLGEGGYGRIVSKFTTVGYRIYMQTGNAIAFNNDSDFIYTDAGTITLNESNYVCGTTNGTSGLVYIDGVQKASGSLPTITSVPSTPLYLGNQLDQTRTFDGWVDETRISNIVRSSYWIKTTNYSNKDDLISFIEAKQYKYSGYVYQYGSPVQRQLYLYERNSGELMDSITSNSSGFYSLYTTSSGVHNVVCLDAVEVPDFDDMIISKVTPTEIV